MNGSISYHVGQFFLDRMKQRDPDSICQIDAGTGEQETVRSLLTRTVRLARSLQSVGLQPGDVLALVTTNHLDSRVPYYAAMLVGLPVAGVDIDHKYHEIKSFLDMTKTKIIFCQQEQREEYLRVVNDLGLDLKIITFDGVDNMTTFIENNDDNRPINDYEPVQFDPESTYAWLVSTSGTTGIPKVAAFTHRGVANCLMNWMEILGLPDTPETFTLNKPVMSLAPAQWISSYAICFGVPAMGGCLVQTSSSGVEHFIDAINLYKPTAVLSLPSLMSLILKNEKQCDLTCFDVIALGGAKVHRDLYTELKTRMRNDAKLREVYGQTEAGMVICMTSDNTPVDSCGRVQELFTAKLIDPDTGLEITEPHKPGELWLKGPHFDYPNRSYLLRCYGVAAGSPYVYLNNPEETAGSFSADGWLKTGDLFYKDEEENLFYFERIKMLIKYYDFDVAPLELEEVILTHRGVQEVAVSCVPHAADGYHPVACVVRRPGAAVTAQEIKDLIARNLCDSKHLRGGVIFMERLPKTSIGKINRKALKDVAMSSPRE